MFAARNNPGIETFGIEDRDGHSRWRFRPHPWLLVLMSERTGFSIYGPGAADDF
jgi:hypothetical protein